jgi:hypothetical protein
MTISAAIMSSGVLVALSSVAGLFFLRFWRKTQDRFFLLFGLAFWTFALNWTGLAFTAPAHEARTYLYFFRLVGFVLILIAIVDKNRNPPRGSA